MASEAVEIVRRAYDAYDADGIEGLIPFLDPEIEWRNPENSPLAESFTPTTGFGSGSGSPTRSSTRRPGSGSAPRRSLLSRVGPRASEP